MALGMSIPNRICKCIDKLWVKEELCDFTVQINDLSIKCHRFILGACSPFFLGLLRSGMKEANEGRVVLQNISVSTFQLILKTLYTGEDVLSLDNFIEIWHAVDMLQIEFLVELCETFATKNIKLENFSEIFSTANLFNSKLVLSSVKAFLIQNIKAIYTSKLYLELSFDEMCFIISSHGLHFNSEDPVLEMVLNWAEYKHGAKGSEVVNKFTRNHKKFKTIEPVHSLHNVSMEFLQHNSLEVESAFVTESTDCENKPIDVTHNDNESNRSESEDSVQTDSLCCNSKTISSENLSTDRFDTISHCSSNPPFSENLSSDRFDELNILLRQVRTCIISPSLLTNVLKHRLIKRNDNACQIILSAVVKRMSFRHGQWPSSGIYRQFHKYGSFCVTYMNGTGKFLLIDPLDEKRYTLTSCPRLCRNIQLVAFDKELYATGGQFVNQITSDIFVYRDKSWTHVVEITGTSILLASNGQYIYVTNVSKHVIYQHNPKCNSPMVKFTDLPAACFATHVMSYHMYLLFFNGFKETEIHMLDLQDKRWTRLDNLDGPAKNIISFRNDDNHFVLQTNGNLWVLKETGENIRFTRVAKLWNLDQVLYGAVVYGDKLVIFYKYLEHWPKDTFVHKLDNVFHSVSYYKLSSPCSKLIPVVLPKSSLLKILHKWDV
ncbi:uncharacterized protein LOC131951685 [Physella acuta]|uniref:uncharacterized protein LOC131951685 n=1 Tax=Physella acuta TaxID=109671 RepID=UPI0027DCD427|nr:uncharacterized protein LOC131951685 [Physella acuta]